MDNWNFGLTLTVVGAAGTFLTMGLLILAITVLKKVFPLVRETTKSGTGK